MARERRRERHRPRARRRRQRARRAPRVAQRRRRRRHRRPRRPATTRQPDPRHRRRPRSPHPAPAPAPTTPPRRLAADAKPAAGGRRRCPIPDYDELSASQVVERLEGLDRDSLEAIRALRERATAVATRSWARSRSSADVEASRPAGEPTTSRGSSSCARLHARRAGGDEGRRALAGTRGVARTARRRVRRAARHATTRCVVVGTIDDVVLGFGAVVVETAALRRSASAWSPTCSSRRKRARWASARRSWTIVDRVLRRTRLHRHRRRSRCPATGRRRTSSKSTTFTARVLTMHHRLDLERPVEPRP